ncbi:MAG TPA: vWA domain-containing protein [Thermoanaerobaculia bacterium]|jgi:hypothetical protein
MRLPLNLGLIVLALAAMPLAAAESQSVCEKDVLLYVDTSKTMRTPRAGGVSRLQVFTRAIDDLLARTSDFLVTGDRVRLVTFAGKAHVAFDETIDGDGASRLSAELMRLRGLDAETDDAASQATDLTLVLNDLQAELTRGRKTYVILASDLIHDPENENKRNQKNREEAFLQRLADFKRNVAAETIPEMIILDANVGGDLDAGVGKKITDALLTAPLHADRIPVTGESAVAQQLKRRIGKAMLAAVELRSDGGKARLVLKVTNPNAFPVRLLQTKADGKDTPVNRLIGCGATATIDISAPPGAQITAEFDVGENPPASVIRDVLDLEARESRVLLGVMGKGTLLLQMHVRKLLTDDARVDVEIAGHEKRTLSIRKGIADEPVTFAIPISTNAAGLRADETVHARFTVDGDIVLPKGTTSGNESTYESETKTEGDWRDTIPRVIRCFVIFLISWLLPGQGITRRIFSAAMDSNVLDLLPGPERYAHSSIALMSLFVPAYFVSGGHWAAWVNAFPIALMAAICMFYLLRVLALFYWALAVEPRGTMLPPKVAEKRLATLSATIWSCTAVAFVAVEMSMASVVPSALAAAQ